MGVKEMDIGDMTMDRRIEGTQAEIIITKGKMIEAVEESGIGSLTMIEAGRGKEETEIGKSQLHTEEIA